MLIVSDKFDFEDKSSMELLGFAEGNRENMGFGGIQRRKGAKRNDLSPSVFLHFFTFFDHLFP